MCIKNNLLFLNKKIFFIIFITQLFLRLIYYDLNMERFYDYQVCCAKMNANYLCSTFSVYNDNKATFARERKGFLK